LFYKKTKLGWAGLGLVHPPNRGQYHKVLAKSKPFQGFFQRGGHSLRETFLSPSRTRTRTKQGKHSMKFAVKVWSNGRARSGVLQLGGCPSLIETPSLLLSTRKGLPFFIPPDFLPSLPSPDSHLLQVCPFHL
jgi:hypothetical protein